MSEDKMPRWAKGVLDKCDRIVESMVLFQEDFKDKIGKKGYKELSAWIDGLKEIYKTVKEIATAEAKPKITLEQTLEALKERHFDGSYILGVGEGDLVLKTLRLNTYPDAIENMEIKETPIEVKMTKRAIEITTAEGTVSKPIPKGILSLKLIDGRSGEVVR